MLKRSATACVVAIVLLCASLEGGTSIYVNPGETDAIHAIAFDQPQLTAVMYDTSGVITDPLTAAPILFDAYIDTGASGFVLSYLTTRGFSYADLLGDTVTVAGLGIDGKPGQFIGTYTDSGIGGSEAGDVTRTDTPYGIRIRNGTPLEATIDPDTLEIIPPVVNMAEFSDQGTHSFWARRQVGFGEMMTVEGMLLDVTPLNVVGMPVISRNVMIMDPTTLGVGADGLSVTRMTTKLVPKNATLPTTNMTFNLALQDFVGNVPTGEVAPSHSRNPVFPNVTIANIDAGGTHSSGNNRWLFDTGSGASMITFAKAQDIGLIDKGVYPTYAEFMAGFDGVTMPIAGVGSIDAALDVPLMVLSEVSITAADGTPVVWRNVAVLILGTEIADPTNPEMAAFDGVFGMNMLLPASTVDLKTLADLGRNDGYFDAIVFNTIDESSAQLSLEFNPAPETSTLVLLAAGGLAMLRRRRAA